MGSMLILSLRDGWRAVSRLTFARYSCPGHLDAEPSPSVSHMCLLTGVRAIRVHFC